MAESKLLSFEPVLDQHGEHRSWTSQKYNKTYYVFNVKFENGDYGNANSTSQYPKWKTGNVYTYTLEIKQGQYGEQRNIKGMKDISFDNKGGGRKRSPENEKVIINQVAFISYNLSMNVLKDEDDQGREIAVDGNKVYLEFRSWMYDKIFNLNEDPITTQGVLKIACNNKAMKGEKVFVKDILTLANGILKAVKNTEWKNPMSQPQQSNLRQSEQPTTPPVETPPIERRPENKVLPELNM